MRQNTGGFSDCIFDLYGTLVDIRTNEEKPEVWERLSQFYAYYRAFYAPEEMHAAYDRLTKNLSAGKEGGAGIPTKLFRRSRSRKYSGRFLKRKARRQMNRW